MTPIVRHRYSFSMALLGLAACASAPTSLMIDTDPQGADVECPQIGYLGTTPLEWKLTDKDLDKLASGGEVVMNVNISKRGFVTVPVPLRFAMEATHSVKKILEPRLAEVAITSEPDGVGVFQLILDDKTGKNPALFKADPLGFARVHPDKVTQRFLGSTPTSYRYDPDHPLNNNEPLLFTKSGYKDQVALFKEREARLHRIMQK